MFFCRLVQLDKLRLQTRAKEEEQALARGGKDPFIVVKNPSASKGGVAETSIKARLLEGYIHISYYFRVHISFTTFCFTKDLSQFFSSNENCQQSNGKNPLDFHEFIPTKEFSPFFSSN